MGYLAAIHIRTVDHKTAAAIVNRYGGAFTEVGSDFYAIDCSTREFQCPENELIAFSDQLNTDVIWLVFESVTDSFEFGHWCCGGRTRKLCYGGNSERVWSSVEGDEEPWERAAIFECDIDSLLSGYYDAPE